MYDKVNGARYYRYLEDEERHGFYTILTESV